MQKHVYAKIKNNKKKKIKDTEVLLFLSSLSLSSQFLTLTHSTSVYSTHC